VKKAGVICLAMPCKTIVGQELR